jgi:hypothetical protein
MQLKKELSEAEKNEKVMLVKTLKNKMQKNSMAGKSMKDLTKMATLLLEKRIS